MLGGGALSWDHLSPFPPLGSDLEVPGSREGGFLGSSLRGSGGFFLDDGVLLPSSGFGTRWQKSKSRSTCWVGSTPTPPPAVFRCPQVTRESRLLQTARRICVSLRRGMLG